MPGPGFPVANKILYKYEQDRAFRLHRQKVNASRATVKNNKPKKYPHLILQLKKIQLEEERQAEVDHENKLLLQKMTKIMKERAQVDTWNEYEAKSLNMPEREKQNREIQMENIGIARRLEKTKPVIKSQSLEQDYQQSRYLQMLWAENARDYDVVVPRHQKHRALRRLRESDSSLAKSEGDITPRGDDKKESLPPISIRYTGGQESNKGTRGEDRKSDDGSMTDRSVNASQVDTDVKALFKVAKQLAQPEDVIVKHLVKRSHSHRMQIKTKFKETYELDLMTELKSGLGADWDVLIDALLKDRSNSAARKLHDLLEEGDYSGAVELLFSLKNRELSQLKESYRKEYGESLENAISDKTENPERVLLLALQKGGRDESSKLDERLAQIDADDLFESGDGRWSSDSGKFIKILRARSNKHIRTVLNLYKVTSGGTEATVEIKRECTKNYAEALLTLITCLQGAEAHYAEKLFQSMSATDPTFVNTLVVRSEIDMPAIRKAYKKKYDADLADDIRHKCSHQTTNVLLELANRSVGSNNAKKSTQQSKYGTPNLVPPQSRAPVKRPTNTGTSTTSKSMKGNPLSQPSQRIAADAAAVRKDEMKTKEAENEVKREQERQKKNVSGTIHPSNNFNPNTDCERLKEAVSGSNTEETVTDILPNRSNGQRQILKKRYQEKYKKDLMAQLKSELSGDYEEVILGLMFPPQEYDAYCLHEAVDGIGTSEATLIGILSTRDAKEKKEIKEIYKREYKSELEKDIRGDTSGDFTDLLVALSKGERSQDSTVNLQQAQSDAKKLHKNGQLAIDTKDEVFINILVKKSHAQVKATFKEYDKLAGYDIYQGLANAMLGDAEKGYVGLAKAIEDPIQFFVERLETCFSGLGTNDNMLIRILVSRSEIDLQAIKERYQQVYGKSLASRVKDECSGAYKTLLLAILGEE